MKRPVYLDHQATTPVDPRVLEAMLPYFAERFGNAASAGHLYGWEAQAAVKTAREQCARILGAEPIDIVFTSGSTEGINLAVKGAAELAGRAGGRIVTCASEHPATLDAVRHLERNGCAVTWLSLDAEGRIDLDELDLALADGAFLVALMAANNEVGTLHPIAEIGARCRERRVLFFCDATQAVGKIPLDVERDHVDILSWSAHKMYGPKGVGALYVRKRHPHVRLAAQMHGGGHERGMRSGTLNVSGIVGLGKACEVSQAELGEEAPRLAALRERLHSGISGALDDVALNGPREPRLPGNLNLSFRYVDGEALMMDMKDLAVSSGAACSSESREPSHVLKALGLADERAHSAIRFGLGRMTTAGEIELAIRCVTASVRRLRELSPDYEMRRRRDGGAPW